MDIKEFAQKSIDIKEIKTFLESIVNDPDQCQAYVKELINIYRLLFVNKKTDDDEDQLHEPLNVDTRY